MNTTEIRTEIDDLLDIVQEQDENFLKSIRSLLDTYVQELNESIMGYQADGTVITTAEFLKQAEISLKEVENGEYITVEELDKQSKEWLIRTR